MVVFKRIIVLFLMFECVLCRNRTGTPCSEDDLTGVCKRIYQCPYAVNLVDGEEKKAPTCEFDGMVRIVCCPSQNLLYRTGVLKEYFKGSNDGVIRSKDMTCRYEGRQPVLCCQNTPDIPDPPEPKQCPPLPQPKLKTKVQHFAWQKCVNYQRYFNKCISVNDHPNSFERINTCGIPTNNTVFRIFGGTPAMPRQFPHMAVVGCHNSIFTDDVDVIWVGGGSLISEKFILTAAHVLVENLHGRIRYAMMGTLNKTDTKSGILYNVIRIINHKAYQKGSKLHDIALLELNERFHKNASHREGGRQRALVISFVVHRSRATKKCDWCRARTIPQNVTNNTTTATNDPCSKYNSHLFILRKLKLIIFNIKTKSPRNHYYMI